MKAYGKKVWLIPDCFLDLVSKNDGLSHEAICVINTADTDAKLNITLLYEDREAKGGIEWVVPAMKTNHIRMDKIRDAEGKLLPRDTPYAALVESDTPIVVQYSRLDTAQGGMALMTTIAYSED